jgi:hypothetical protein
MSGNAGSGVRGGAGEVAGRAAGVAIGVALGDLILSRRQRRLAAEAVGHFGAGENLAAPIGFCSRGGRPILISGTALMAVSLLAAICLAPFSDGVASAVGFGGMGAGWLVIVASLPFATNYVVVLTDRRLLLFRTTGIFKQRVREIWIGVPRSDVSMNIRGRIDGAALSFGFAPATGIAPIRLDVYRNGAGVQYAHAIQRALATPVVDDRADMRRANVVGSS